MSNACAAVATRFDEMGHRIAETRVEIEPRLKSELTGRLSHFETQREERIAKLDDRIFSP